MQSKRTLELWVGLFVLAGIAALAMLSFRVGNLGSTRISNGYELTAVFDNIGGLKTKAPVTMAGVPVGRIMGIEVDAKDFRAVVRMRIAAAYNQIPADSTARILTAGILGEQYVSLEPGADTATLKAGDRILLTQSALVLENIVGRFVFGMAENKGK